MKTPVLLLIFNRPDTTRRVVEALRQARPEKLYIAADGPRPDRTGEKELCAQARAIALNATGDCRVRKLFRRSNLGCKRAVSSAISWFFTNEPEGIILEDDCLPGESFFRFCETLLSRYRTDQRIMHISGNNFQQGKPRGSASYYFSRYSHVWGWASWRRAWRHYDVRMTSLPEFLRTNQLRSIFPAARVQRYWREKLRATHDGRIDTWDYQWAYAVWSQNGLSVLPNVNLVRNIGYGARATHTSGTDQLVASMKSGEIDRIIHPGFVLPDADADAYTFQHHFQQPLARRIRGTVSRMIP